MLMNFQPVSFLNDLFTHFTDIMVLNNMYAFMSLQMALLTECLITYFI